MANNITILELAAALGLSKSTVSRAFRDNNDIKPATKEMILKKATEMGYAPNLYASNLRGNKSYTIAIVIPEFGNKFFSQAIKGIEKITRSKNYHILIYVTEHDATNEANIVRTVINGRVDGVIMSASGEGKSHTYLDLLKQHHIPLVFFDRYYEDVNTVCVTGNDYEASFEATEHLIQNGCKKIGYLAINKDFSIGKIRMDGYLNALRKHGIASDERLIVDTYNETEKSLRDIENLILHMRPDGIFAAVERLAISTLRACRAHQIRIPEDLKLICFSCLDIADILNPPLSVVKQPAFEMGKRAAECLLDLLAAKRQSEKKELIILPSELIYQASSGGKI